MNEITVINKNVIAEIENNGASNIIKPLQKETYLTDLYLYNVDECPVTRLVKIKKGDELTLKHEETLCDKLNVSAYTADGVRVGDLSDLVNDVYARLLDAGKILKATVACCGFSPENSFVKIAVSLVDF
ncbi:MAG: hypothetical protein LUD27_08905 [Clostridia bacterium]|nr:hypothetical protein [Clostridia bacterium]